jgi:hypothetical protein
MRSHFFGYSEGAQGDRRISKYEMLRFAPHDKKMGNYIFDSLYHIGRRGGVSPPGAGKPRPLQKIIERFKYIIPKKM